MGESCRRQTFYGVYCIARGKRYNRGQSMAGFWRVSWLGRDSRFVVLLIVGGFIYEGSARESAKEQSRLRPACVFERLRGSRRRDGARGWARLGPGTRRRGRR